MSFCLVSGLQLCLLAAHLSNCHKQTELSKCLPHSCFLLHLHSHILLWSCTKVHLLLSAARLLRKLVSDAAQPVLDAAQNEPADCIPAFRSSWAPHLEPKVMVAFKHAPGSTPREVLVQRTKRAYQHFDLEGHLKASGVDHSTPAGVLALSGHLELSLFDDETFESRTHAEWIPSTGSVATPARVLWPNPNGTATFQRASVHAVDPSSNQYSLKLCSGVAESSATMHRIYVCFDAEDPRTYAERLITAYRSRRDTEVALLEGLLIDSMPHSDMPQLPVEQINRMLNYALNSKALKTQMKLMDTSMLVSEVNIEFARSLNKIIFEHIVALSTATGRPSALPDFMVNFPPLPLPHSPQNRRSRPVPDWGTVPVASHNFPETFSQFAFSSLLTKAEVINALVRIRGECVKVMEKSLFHLFPTKTVTIPDFLQVWEIAGHLCFLF
jgi:dynein heavy chain, axonemal